MIFNSLPFALFFFAFLILYYFVLRTHGQRIWLICIGSLVFYGSWNYRFIPILVGTGLVDFFIARSISSSEEARYRKSLFVLSVSMNIGVLAFFKYTNFLLDNGHQLLGLVGLHLPRAAFTIAAPLGISFYTFQSISYTADVYRGVLEPRKRVHEFIASLTFFPHLVSGPIVRSSNLLPQFERLSPPQTDDLYRGFLLIGSGLCKKTIADLLAPTVEQVFNVAAPHSGLQSWTAVLAYAAQIFGDFSGYTDMAMGISLLLGFKLPNNFDFPFCATSPVNFWSRWHITLSEWLRDYLYTPLALVNRRFPYSNLIITMVLAGLWHGPRWTYVAFGLYHGLGLAATEWLGSHAPGRWHDMSEHWAVRAAQSLATFYFVLIAFVLFRSESMVRAFDVIRDLHHPRVPSTWTYEATMLLLGAVAAIVFGHLLDYLVQRRLFTSARRWIPWAVTAACFAFAMALGTVDKPFIYFDF